MPRPYAEWSQGHRSPDWLVHSHQLGPVGKSCFHLDLGDHLRHTVHHFLATQDLFPSAHQLGDRPTIARALQQVGGDDCDRFGLIQLQPTRRAATRQVGGDENQ